MTHLRLVKPSLPLNRIIQGDSIEVLNRLPAKSVDLIFADPPYNLQLQGELRRPNNTVVDAVDDDWDRFAGFDAYDHFSHEWLAACKRVLKDTGTLWVIGSYHNIYRVGATLMDLGYWILNDVVWVKTNPMPNFRGVRFTNAHETLLWAQKHKGASYTFNYKAMKALNDDLQMRSDWELPICNGKARLRIDGEKAHPTQKPEALLYRIIQSSSNPGDVVLDPFFGSGTTGAVAKLLHRHWVGIEREPAYINAAQARIDAVTPLPYSDDLFHFPGKRRQRRIPFGRLLEAGYLKPGQSLRLGTKGDIFAQIQANGQLKHKTVQGSIHQVAKSLKNRPVNGWEHWYYLDQTSGVWQPIDYFRELIRNQQTVDSAQLEQAA